MGRLRSWWLALFATLLAGCWGSDSTLTIRLNALVDSDLGDIAVAVEHGGAGAAYNLDDFARGPDSNILGVGPFSVPDEGEISVVMTYTDPQGRMSEATSTWSLRPDFEWGLQVWGSAPTDQCMGCRASWPFEAVASQGDQGPCGSCSAAPRRAWTLCTEHSFVVWREPIVPAQDRLLRRALYLQGDHVDWRDSHCYTVRSWHWLTSSSC